MRSNSTNLMIGDDELALHDRLTASNNEIDDILRQGHESLYALRSQRETIKDVRRKMLDIAQQLGVSTTVLRMIERRVGTDKIIFGVGATIVIIVIYLFYRFYKS